MGLLDNVFSGTSPSNRGLSKAESFAGILLGASACDGHIANEEVQGLFTITERMKLFENMSPDQWNGMMNTLIKILNREGVEKLIQRCSNGLPDDLRDSVFANACDIVLADGVVEEEEKAFLENLQRVLEIDGDTALTIVEVMIIKNKG